MLHNFSFVIFQRTIICQRGGGSRTFTKLIISFQAVLVVELNNRKKFLFSPVFSTRSQSINYA